MEINVLQAALIAFVGYSGARWAIPLGDFGWWTVGRPLVAGLVIGIILGDAAYGVMLGAAVNSLYLGTITVGGVAASDINFAAYIGIPLAMASGASVEEGLVLAALLGALGIFMWNFVKIINVYWIRVMEKHLDKGDLDKAARVPITGNIFLFLGRFFPIFLACYLGPELMQQFMNAIPPQINQIVAIFGGMLPLIGFAIILKASVKRSFELIYFVFGFILFTNFQVSVVSILVVAIVFALVDFRYGKTVGGNA